MGPCSNQRWEVIAYFEICKVAMKQQPTFMKIEPRGKIVALYIVHQSKKKYNVSCQWLTYRECVIEFNERILNIRQAKEVSISGITLKINKNPINFWEKRNIKSCQGSSYENPYVSEKKWRHCLLTLGVFTPNMHFSGATCMTRRSFSNR